MFFLLHYLSLSKHNLGNHDELILPEDDKFFGRTRYKVNYYNYAELAIKGKVTNILENPKSKN